MSMSLSFLSNELSSPQALEELRRELLGAETIRSSQEKSPLDYATTATQTDPPEEVGDLHSVPLSLSPAVNFGHPFMWSVCLCLPACLSICLSVCLSV